MSISALLNEIIYTIPAVFIAIILHEWAHGFVSYKLGDPTPKLEGRLSLNPLKHIDWMGALCLLLFHFGWAKPVMVDARYYKDSKMGMMLTALAGPVMNLIIAFFSLLIVLLMFKYQPEFVLYTSIGDYLSQVLIYTAIMSIGLGVFNMIPIPPLDGSKVLFAFLPQDQYFGYMKYEQYGMILLLLLLATGVIDMILSPVTSGVYQGILNILQMFI